MVVSMKVWYDVTSVSAISTRWMGSTEGTARAQPTARQIRRFGVVRKRATQGFLAMLVFLCLGGCSTYMGNKAITDVTAQEKIEKGVSTKQDVQALFGMPTSVSFTDNDEEVWSYTYMKSSVRKITFIPIIGWFFGGTDTRMYLLTVRYSEDGIVKAFGAGETTGGGGGLQDVGD